MAARAIWKGTISFEGFRQPVKLYSAVEDRSVHFHLLHDKDFVRLKQRLANPDSGKTVSYEDTRRGFEVEPGVLVIFDDDDLVDLEPPASREVEIVSFIKGAELGHRWYDRPYWLGPDGRAGTYFALADVLAAGNLAGIARWVMRKKRYVGALIPRDGYLALMTLRHVGDVIEVEAFESPAGRALEKKELDLAGKLISALESDFEPDDYRDQHRDRMMALIDARRKGETVEVESYEEPAPSESLEKSLRASLAAAR
jgi:DNA end-binding protein Ku